LLKERRFRLRFGQNFLAYADKVPYWAPWPRPPTKRNDLSIYDASADWWGGKTRWLRTLQNLIPARFAFFDPIVGAWRGKAVLDLGCGGGFMAVARCDNWHRPVRSGDCRGATARQSERIGNRLSRRQR
jgi:hypothetical protein